MAALVTIFIPAHNEERYIADVLKQVIKLPIDSEVFVVDDGSTDKTRAIAEEIFKNYSRGAVLTSINRQGKGKALRLALEQAQGKYFAIQDADLEYDPAEIPALVRLMEEEKLDIVFGSRFSRPNPTAYPHYWIGNRFLSLFLSLLTGTGLGDAYTGRKIMKTELIKSWDLVSSGFEIEAEIAVKTGILARRRKIRFQHTPIIYHPRNRLEGKKIEIWDGVSGLARAFQTYLKM